MKYQARESMPSTYHRGPVEDRRRRISPAHRAAATRQGREPGQWTRVTSSCTIDRSIQECYGYWRKLGNLPTFMRNLVSVDERPGGKTHWTAIAPAGKTISWDAVITEAHPGELLSWHTTERSPVMHAVTVWFHPAPPGRGTEVTVSLEYDSPGGKPGKLAAIMFGEEPGQQIGDDLRRFKMLLECDAIVSTAGQPAGRSRMH